jgi:glycine/D-amino acid oxidase-like deaminating enzyme
MEGIRDPVVVPDQQHARSGQEMNRRRFLEAAGAGIGTLALGARRLLATQGSSTTEIVVVGAGAFGGWTALYLREMGFTVTLIDQYGPGNSRATSGGESRQIRAGYGSRDIYTKWVLQAFDRWQAREAEWSKRLFFRTGQITLASQWSRDLIETRKVFDTLGVKYEIVKHDDLTRRYPQMNTASVDFGMFTPSTGVLKAREGCVAVAQAFEKKGGRFVTAKVDLGRRAGSTLQDVALSTGQRVAAQAFVFACGPWLPKVFPAVMKNKLSTPRRVVFFYGTPPGDERFTYPNFPTWSVDNAYGFPSIEGKGFKVVPTFEKVIVDPDTQEHTLTADELRRGREFVKKWFPALAEQPLVESKVCQREDSIDGHFIVDQHPELSNVWLVGGGSGHGYKHGIMLGDYVANRVVGKDKQPELAATFKLKDGSYLSWGWARASNFFRSRQ